MRKTVLLIACVMVLTGGTAAAQSQTVEARPGWIKAGTMLYGLDVAADNALMAVGLASPSAVAYERASEAKVAYRNNNTEAADTALQNVAKLANSSSGGEGLAKAEAVLQQLQQSTPAAADQGLSTALGQVQQHQAQINGSRIEEPPLPGETTDNTSDQTENETGGDVGPPPTPGQ